MMVKMFSMQELEKLKAPDLREIIMSLQEDIQELRFIHQSTQEQNTYQKDMLKDFAERQANLEQELSTLKSAAAATAAIAYQRQNGNNNGDESNQQSPSFFSLEDLSYSIISNDELQDSNQQQHPFSVTIPQQMRLFSGRSTFDHSEVVTNKESFYKNHMIISDSDIALHDPDSSQLTTANMNQSKHQTKSDMHSFISSIFHTTNYLAANKSNIDQSSAAKSALNRSQIQSSAGSLLFEDFLLVCGDLNEIKRQSEQNNTIGSVRPQVLFAYPNTTETTQPAWRSSLCAFSFPYGVGFRKTHPDRLRDTLQTQIFSNHSSSSSSSSSPFIFQMLSLNQEANDSHITLPPFMQQVNPNKTLYCVAHTVESFLRHPDTSNTSAYLLPITICFLTYYPFIEFFDSAIQQIMQLLKNTRVYKYLSFTTQETANQGRACIDPSIDQMLSLDLNHDVHTLAQSKPLLQELQQLQQKASQLRCDFTLSFPLKGVSSNTFTIPRQSKLLHLDTTYSAETTIKLFALEDFMLTLCAVCLEKKVVFFSKNITLLTNTILTFTSLLKPFTYVMPLIYILPVDLQELLDSPMPLIIGINSGIDYKQELKRKRFQFMDKFVIDLDANESSTLRIVCKDTNEIEKLKKCMPVFKQNSCDITNAYFSLNTKKSMTLKQYDTARKKYLASNSNSNSVNNNCNTIKKPLTNNNPSRNSEIVPYAVESNLTSAAVSAFTTAVHEWIHSLIISNIPRNSSTKIFDSMYIESAKATVVAKNSAEKKFIEEFCSTQMFATYAEHIHK